MIDMRGKRISRRRLDEGISHGLTSLFVVWLGYDRIFWP